MDEELNRPIWQIIFDNANIRNQWENELGDFTRANNLSKDLYSNDLRHQYAAAISARNLGADKTRTLGNMNEWINPSGGDAIDGKIDRINNEIGIQYGLKYPNMQKVDLLNKLLEDFDTNRNYRNQQLGL